MFGEGMGTMNVYLQLGSDAIDSWTTLWSRGGNAGNMWRLGKVTVPSTSKDFRVSVIAMHRNTFISFLLNCCFHINVHVFLLISCSRSECAHVHYCC